MLNHTSFDDVLDTSYLMLVRDYGKSIPSAVKLDLIAKTYKNVFRCISDSQVLYQWNGVYYAEIKVLAFTGQLRIMISNSSFKALTQAALTEIYEIIMSLTLCDDINQQPYIPFKNGYFSYLNAQFLPPSIDYHYTYCLDCEYLKNQDCPKFKAFLNMITDDPDTQKLLLAYSALCFTPDVGNQLSLFLIGRGANGKSTYTDIVKGILNKQCTTMEFDELINSENRFASYRMKDATCCICSEIEMEDASNKNINKFKRVITQPTFWVERKGKDPIEIKNRVKYLVDANNLPLISLSDPYAFYRRVRVILFRNRIPVKNRIKNFANLLLEEEAGAIAAYILTFLSDQSCLEENVQESEDLWAQGIDETRFFIDNYLDVTTNEETSFKQIYDTYTQYMNIEGLRALSSIKFAKRLVYVGLKSEHHHQGNYYPVKIKNILAMQNQKLDDILQRELEKTIDQS
jgi:putative DNA primase/helicase